MLIIKEDKIRKALKGFTLTEVMIVVIIIGFIAAFAIPSYQKAILKAKERNARMQLIALYGANEIYATKNNGKYLPGNLALAAINSGLEINIFADDMDYSYKRTAVDAYTATAAWAGGNSFTVQVDEGTIGAGNPCCSAGSCPSLPDC